MIVNIANTYQKLFAAAQSPIVHDNTAAPKTLQRPAPPQRQPSLHNYWSICTPPPQNLGEYSIETPAPSRCEDCEKALPGDSDTCMGGIGEDSSAADEFQCRSCGRRVCDMCAVVETGIGRDCLQCRTSRGTWVGGLGWVS